MLMGHKQDFIKFNIIDPVDKTKSFFNAPHRRSTTVSADTYPLYSFFKWKTSVTVCSLTGFMMMPLGIGRFIVLTETFPPLKYIRKDERFFLSCITYDVDKKHGTSQNHS